MAKYKYRVVEYTVSDKGPQQKTIQDDMSSAKAFALADELNEKQVSISHSSLETLKSYVVKLSRSTQDAIQLENR